MATCMLAYPNRSDAGVLTGAPFSAALPVTNLQNRYLSKFARTTGTGLVTPTPAMPGGGQCSAYINVNMGQGRYITAAALVKHNMSLQAKARMVLWSDATMTTPLFDSGWADVWPRYYDTVGLRWNASNFLFGRITQDDFGVVPAMWLQMVSNGSGGVAPFAAQYATIYVLDTDNTAGFLQFGRLYVAEDWTPLHNFTWGDTSIAWVDRSIVDTALDGTEHYEQRSMYRSVSFTLPYLRGAEGVTKALNMTRNRGITGDFLFIWDPYDAQLLQQRSFVGRLEALNPLEYTMPNNTRMTFKIKELI